MGEKQKAESCTHYPLCKHFEPLFADLHSGEPPARDEVVFPRDAEPICSQCKDFEPENAPGVT